MYVVSMGTKMKNPQGPLLVEKTRDGGNKYPAIHNSVLTIQVDDTSCEAGVNWYQKLHLTRHCTVLSL